MEARELRIGNLVGLGVKTVDIKSFTRTDINPIETTIYVGLNNIARNYPVDINELTPIPLTEEWLIKFGFIQYGDEGEYFKHKKLFAFEFLNQGIEFKVYFSDVVFTHVKHVHQLQNLYFSLTGKELTIKE